MLDGTFALLVTSTVLGPSPYITMFTGQSRERRVVGGGRSTHAVASGVDVVERARREREARALERSQAHATLELQRVYRGHAARTRAVRLELDGVVSKINHLGRVQALLAASGRPFAAPLPLLCSLSRPLAVLHMPVLMRSKVVTAWTALCALWRGALVTPVAPGAGAALIPIVTGRHLQQRAQATVLLFSSITRTLQAVADAIAPALRAPTPAAQLAIPESATSLLSACVELIRAVCSPQEWAVASSTPRSEWDAMDAWRGRMCELLLSNEALHAVLLLLLQHSCWVTAFPASSSAASPSPPSHLPALSAAATALLAGAAAALHSSHAIPTPALSRGIFLAMSIPHVADQLVLRLQQPESPHVHALLRLCHSGAVSLHASADSLKLGVAPGTAVPCDAMAVLIPFVLANVCALAPLLTRAPLPALVAVSSVPAAAAAPAGRVAAIRVYAQLINRLVSTCPLTALVSPAVAPALATGGIDVSSATGDGSTAPPSTRAAGADAGILDDTDVSVARADDFENDDGDDDADADLDGVSMRCAAVCTCASDRLPCATAVGSQDEYVPGPHSTSVPAAMHTIAASSRDDT